ncbi:MAG: PUTATIVE ZINC PROTEASE PROTEIN [uncultured Thiotrichaceae bacterium]|uniref:PUTATIVE ZINC PROTEASE PROTEIN n=1 Tax=uncultured Thiotrichaceae bacterium TaxID=298394 RepID=A0A6S6TWF7_9GAMM|nr:MAG: PUTATIVE ZINC PROTEASE PROTEIN [uncultured Thiotrichaceae bacterium]
MIHGHNLNIPVLLVIILSSFILGGCETLSYYQQMGTGHLDLMNKRELISTRINKTDIAPEEKRKLELVVSAKKFAREHLHLPVNSSYRHYSDLKRPYVTWNVVATKPLSMTPAPSCFPIVGCLSYRGYFKKTDAEHYAKKLDQQGLETYIAGSSAYSTLGWFDDPVVSTMLRYDDYFLLETLFHELAHQKVYFPDDSNFNEAFASAIGQYGVRKWLETHGTTQDIQNYEIYLNRRTAFTEMLEHTADELRRIFKQKNKSKESLLEEKKAEYATLMMRYSLFKQKHAYNGYDNWFKKPVNNPRLAIVSTYHHLVSNFNEHLKQCDNDLDRFYRSISTLSALSPSLRKKTLLHSGGCTVK